MKKMGCLRKRLIIEGLGVFAVLFLLAAVNVSLVERSFGAEPQAIPIIEYGERGPGKVVLGTVAMKVDMSKEENIKKYIQYIEAAAKKGVNLLVFPECSLTFYIHLFGHLQKDVSWSYVDWMKHITQNAETVPGPTTDLIAQYAKAYKMYIVFGMAEKTKWGGDVVSFRYYNTAVLVGPEGLIGAYRKIHLPLDEYHIFTPGKEWPVFDTALGKIGMLICFDKGFPEGCRVMAIKGANILVMPTCWPSGVAAVRYDPFDQARAAENQVFFISSNWVGFYEKYNGACYGHSNIVDPGANILASAGADEKTEGIAIASVNVVESIRNARTRLNYPRDRRPDTYKLITDDLYPPCYYK